MAGRIERGYQLFSTNNISQSGKNDDVEFLSGATQIRPEKLNTVMEDLSGLFENIIMNGGPER